MTTQKIQLVPVSLGWLVENNKIKFLAVVLAHCQVESALGGALNTTTPQKKYILAIKINKTSAPYDIFSSMI